MGYKPSSTHRRDAYKSECECRQNVFGELRPAREHAESCGARRVYYCPQYGEPVVVWEPEGWDLK